MTLTALIHNEQAISLLYLYERYASLFDNNSPWQFNRRQLLKQGCLEGSLSCQARSR